MNTLPARVHVRAGDEIVLWLHKLQQQQVELRQYEYTPLPKIYEWKHLPRNQFLFESYLVVQNFQGLAATLERPVAKQEEQRLYSPKMPTFFIAKQEYPLRIDVFPGPEIELILSYYQRSFNAATISTMLKHWQIMLENIVDHPERSCGELLLLLE
jgi:non-ribosomal peptide synthetase component F